MTRRLFCLFMMVFVLPILACNLSSNDDNKNAVPTTGPVIGPIQLTATAIVSQGGDDVPGVPTATLFPSVTPTRQVVANNPTPQPSGPPSFSNISFSTTAGGADMTIFPPGTKEIYVRWNYANVPIGTNMTRQWYRDGILVTSRDEAWSSNWGITGRLTHIKYFDTQAGLPAGSYYVVIRLSTYGTEISGTFTISGVAPTFSNLTFSSISGGTATTVFPYGTQEVYARWQFANVPSGAVMRREWYRNGAQFISRDEAWKPEWGTSGTLSHIRTYNFDSGYGLEPGDYRVLIYLRDFPTVRVEGTFKVESNLGPRFTNLRFATSGNGTAATNFPNGTKAVFAIWDYANMPNAAQVRRIWIRDGVTVADRTEAWDFSKYGTSGTVRDVSLFDNVAGLTPGTYQVRILVVGQAGVEVNGTFTIAGSTTTPTFSSLTFSTTANGTTQSNFPTNTKQVFARWNYANVPNGSQLVVEWYLNGLIQFTRPQTWNTTTTSGTFTDTPFDGSTNIAPGTWQVKTQLSGYPSTALNASFSVAAQTVPPSIGNLGVSATANGSLATEFPYNQGAVYAAFDFANVSPATEIRAQLQSIDGGSFNIELVGTWVYATNGRVTDLWIGNPTQALSAGLYRLTIRLPASGVSVSTEFKINPPNDPVVDPNFPFYIPPQLDPKATPPVTPVGAWVRVGP
ncbi:MAG: hypothetical protein BroJett018_04420 [Chloroflexota bacterium]|nr:MAG: hypothetical protein BroJett018_04420 [Chloroflexota bacterium]